MRRGLGEAILSPARLRDAISKLPADAKAKQDYIDDDTGEIVLERGQRADTCRLHPAYKPPRKWYEPAPDAEDDEDAGYAAAERAYATASRTYAAQFAGELDDPDSQAPDAAEGFFSEYPKWREWARILRLSRRDIKSAVAELIAG